MSYCRSNIKFIGNRYRTRVSESVLGQKTGYGVSLPRTKGDFYQMYGQDILDNSKSRGIFCLIRRSIDVLDPENQPGSGALRLTEDV